MRVIGCVLLVFILFSVSPIQAQQEAKEEEFTTAESVVKEMYKLVSFDSTQTPDWDEVKNLFLEEAVIILRTARDVFQILTKDGFVQLFIDDIKKYNLDKTGFTEKIVNIKIQLFGDIAHCFTVYEVGIPNTNRPPFRGVDSFQLVKKDGRWWIASVTNEIPTANNPIPKELMK